MSPTTSTSSAVNTPDPQSRGPSASLVENEETQKTKKGSLTPPNQLMEKTSERIYIDKSNTNKLPVTT
jgi:hypothetical protein